MCCSMRLQRFCCCCSLKTGSIIIAILGWAGTIVKLFGLVGLNMQPTTSSAQYDDNSNIQIYQFNEMDRRTYGVRIGYAVVSLLACALLVWGIHKRNNKFMLPWLIINCLESILISIAALAMFVLIFVVPSNAIAIMVALFVLICIITYLTWYFWLCVWSHYMELNETECTLDVNYVPNISNPPPYKEGYSMA